MGSWRRGPERLLRYCAGPAFALKRLPENRCRALGLVCVLMSKHVVAAQDAMLEAIEAHGLVVALRSMSGFLALTGRRISAESVSSFCIVGSFLRRFGRVSSPLTTCHFWESLNGARITARPVSSAGI
jgi:hypothetical protein